MLMLSAGDTGIFKLWDTATGEERATFVGHATSVTACTFSADRATIVSGSADGLNTIKNWLKTIRRLMRFGVTMNLGGDDPTLNVRPVQE